MAKLQPWNKVSIFNQSLADHLKAAGWAVFTEIPLGAAQSEDVGRVDVLALKKSYNVRIQAYECKVSRGDFNSDVSRGKYQRYFERVHQVYFACPAELVKTIEIPADAGLITKSAKGWHSVKTAPIHNPGPISTNLLLQCIFREQEEVAATRRLTDRVIWEENYTFGERAKNLGHETAKRLRDVDKSWAEIHEISRLLESLVGKQSTYLSLVERVREYVADVKKADLMPLAVELVAIADGLLSSNGSLWRGRTIPRLETVLRNLREQSLGY